MTDGTSRAPLVCVRVWWLVLMVGCGEPEVERFEVAQFPAVPVTQLDLVMLVDNSGGTVEWQVSMGLAAPTLLAGLTIDGALPDLHIGFVTSDMGTTGSLDPEHPAPVVGTVGNGGCAGDGDGGFMKTILFDEDDGLGGRTRNYDGTLANAFAFAMRIGATGCGFEQHLHAIRRARRVNENFWRTDASRAVIVVADEDDCSVRDAMVFDAGTDLGPLTSFRCTRFGLVCDQPLDTVGEKTNCRTNTSSQLIEDPALTKSDLEFGINGPERFTFSVLDGTPGPIVIEERTQGTETQRALGHSCSKNGPTGPQIADPGIRLAALADSFASRGGFYSVCDPDYLTTAARIAQTIKRSLGIACLDAATVTDDCEVFDVVERTRTAVPRCPANGDCFDITPDAARCGGAPSVTIDRKTTPAPTTRVEVRCAAPDAPH